MEAFLNSVYWKLSHGVFIATHPLFFDEREDLSTIYKTSTRIMMLPVVTGDNAKIHIML